MTPFLFRESLRALIAKAKSGGQMTEAQINREMLRAVMLRAAEPVSAPDTAVAASGGHRDSREPDPAVYGPLRGSQGYQEV